MADETAAALARIQDRSKMLRGGFYAADQPRAADLPFRPIDQPVSGPPEGPKRNWYVDRIEGDPGHRMSVLIDPAGVPHDEPMRAGMKEGFYEAGGQPDGSEASAIHARLLHDPNPQSLIQLGDALPKVPLAPGSPGPPIPPPADAFVGQKRAGKKPQKPPAQQ